MHRLVRLGGQVFEGVRQKGLGVDPLEVAVADERVERGDRVFCGGAAHEPALIADGAGTDRVFHKVAVDLHTAFTTEHAEPVPLIER